MRWQNYLFIRMGLSIKRKTENIFSLKAFRAFLHTLQMWNLCTDSRTVSINNYFAALCGDKRSLLVWSFFPVSRSAIQEACRTLSNSVGNDKREKKKELLIEEISELSERILYISILINSFAAKYYLLDNMFAYAKKQGFVRKGVFDVKIASKRINFLTVKRKQLIFELRTIFGEVSNDKMLTYEDLVKQITRLNMSNANITLESSVAYYFGSVKAILEENKKMEQRLKK